LFAMLYSVIGVSILDDYITPGSKDSMGYFGLIFISIWANDRV